MTISLALFDTTTLQAMQNDARRVAESAYNDDQTQKEALEAQALIGEEIKLRGRYPAVAIA